jgi:hypothetical protein
MKRYSLEERKKLAQVVVGVRDLARHTDTFLAELTQVHRSNVTAFHRQTRPQALSTKTVDQLLEHYGFVYNSQFGLSPADGEYCPRISFRTDFDDEVSSLKSFIATLSAIKPFTLCQIENKSGDFALLWGYENEPEIKGWCAVALGLGANNSALEHLIAIGVPCGQSFAVDDEIYCAWHAAGPRKSEVLKAYHDEVRKTTSEKLKKGILKGFGDDDVDESNWKSTSAGPTF